MSKEFSKPSDRKGGFSGPRESGRPAQSGGRPDKFKDKPRLSLADEISSIDDELIGLLIRRSRLITKLRGGKTHAASPAAIKSEKQIRSNWEAKAGRVSRDSLFIRQLYNLIQDITVQQKEPETPGTAFNLSPARLPVRMELPGPAMGSRAMLWLSLAAAFGKPLRIEGLQRSQSIMDFVKAFSQAGASLSWAGADDRPSDLTDPAYAETPIDSLWSGALLTGSSQPLNVTGKTLYVGEDPLVFYLLVFLGLCRTGKTRFTAGHALKSANLSALYKMLPDLGARLSFVVPSSRGLPVSLESSGQLPALYVLPAGLPLEAVLAVLLAAFTWRSPLVLSLDSLPGNVAHRALSILEPFFNAFSEAAEVRRSEVHYSAWDGPDSNLPPFMQIAMDPVAAAMTLAVPFFTGGDVRLVGSWPELPESSACIALLRKAGLKVELGQNGIHTSRAENVAGGIARTGGIVAPDLPDALLPLYWVMNARLAALAIKTAGPEAQGADLHLHDVPENADLSLAADFLIQLGLELQDLRPLENGVRLAALPKDEAGAVAAKTHGWSSPGPLWTLAFSLGAFFKSNLKLSNPDSATDLVPAYWAMYNSLPAPRTTVARAAENKPTRRRIITNSVIEAPAEAEDFDSLPDEL